MKCVLHQGIDNRFRYITYYISLHTAIFSGNLPDTAFSDINNN